MLPSKKKINSFIFKNFYNKGIKKNSQNFSVSFIYKKEHEDVFSRYAIIIGKKTAKSAVVRNRIKRKVYNTIDVLYPQFSHLKFVFIFVKRDISNLKNSEIQDEISKLLSS